MRQIKFRGRRIDTGEFVYGDLMHMTGGRIGIIFDKRVAAVEVEPESVAQLIAVDINGRDVYEGDLVERIADYDDEDFDRAKAFPMAATFDDFSAINDGQIILAEAHHDD